jgi:hypothetical protein
MALQAFQIDLAYAQEPGVGRSMWHVTTAATLGLHRDMFVDERPTLVGVALEANCVT